MKEIMEEMVMDAKMPSMSDSEMVSESKWVPDMINVDKLRSMNEVDRNIYLSLLNCNSFRSEISETLKAENIIISQRDYNIDKVTDN